MKRSDNVWTPPARIIGLIVMLGVILGALFSLMLNNWVSGLAAGALFAFAFYFVVVVNARKGSKRLKKRRR